MLTVTIAGTDRTRLIEPDSLRITNVLTSQPDICQFLIKKFGDRTYIPDVDEEVVIEEDGTKIFGGNVIEVDENYEKVDVVNYKVKCKDYTHKIDQRLIVDVFEDQTVTEIIDFIHDKYLPHDITINNVDVDTKIDYIAFNYESPSDALKQLAEISNSDWYIDYDKDIHFFHKDVVLAPFNLSDTNKKYIYETLKIRRDLSQLRTIVFVRGSEYLGDVTTIEFLGDATRRTFYLPNKTSNLQMNVTGEIWNVGIDPIHEGLGYDALHNFQERAIKIREDKIPSSGASIRLSGNPNLPVIIKMRDPAAISTFTGREYLIVDKSIKSKEGARQRALAELLRYKSTLSEAQFDTYETSLISGQKITIQSDLRNLNEDFIINKVETKVFANQDGTPKLVRKISLITTKTFNHINLLQKLLNEKKKEIFIDDNEIIDEVQNIEEVMTFSETIATSVEHNPISESMALAEDVTPEIDYGVLFVLGLWTSGREEGVKRAFIFDGSPLG